MAVVPSFVFLPVLCGGLSSVVGFQGFANPSIFL
jgi:hypothetical protein